MLSNYRQLIDVRQTTEYAKFMKKIGWKIKKTGKINIFIKKLPFLPFSVIKILRFSTPNKEKFMTDAKKIKKENRALIFKLHPFIVSKSDQIVFKNFKSQQDKNPLVPTKTIWLDLNKKNNQLLKQMKQKTRYNIHLSKSKKITIEIVSGNKIKSQLLNDFYQLWKKNKPFNWLFKPSFRNLQALVSSFEKKCFLVLASKNSLIAGALILTSKNMAFYWHNCSNKEGKKLFAPTLVIWQAIKEAKRRNLKIFDFEGIYDSRFHKLMKNWQGFSKFKKGFGGQKILFSKPLKV